MKKYLKYLISIITLLILVAAFMAPNINSIQIKESYAIVERNINSIKNLPGAESLKADSIDSMKKSNVVYIARDFKSSASYEDIKSYYITELKNEGWEFVSEDSPKEMGKDKGYKALDFKKEEMKLEIFYIPPNLQEEYGCNFSISISWDL